MNICVFVVAVVVILALVLVLGFIMFHEHSQREMLNECTDRICREIRDLQKVQSAQQPATPPPLPVQPELPVAPEPSQELPPELPLEMPVAPVLPVVLYSEEAPIPASFAPTTQFPPPLPPAPQPAPPSELSRGWCWFWYGREEIGPDENREFIAASNWLIRFGMLVLVLGLGFFAKYTFEQGWISPKVRIFGMTALGLAMYIAGLRLWRTIHNVLGQACVAGSACVLFFSAFGASEWYGLIPQWAGFAWGVGVALMLTGSALWLNSRLIAILGTLGLYLTPLMFPVLRDDPAVLAIYLAIPIVGMIVIRRSRTWLLPAYLVMFGTWHFWRWTPTEQPVPGVSSFLLAATVALFLALHLMAQRRVRTLTTRSSAWDIVLASLNVLAFIGVVPGILWMWRYSALPLGETYIIQMQPLLYAVVYGGCSLVFLVLAVLLRGSEQCRFFKVLNYTLAFGFMLFAAVCGSDMQDAAIPVALLGCVVFQYIAHKLPSNGLAWVIRTAMVILAAVGFATLGARYGMRGGCFAEPVWGRVLLFLTPAVALLIGAFHAIRASGDARLPGSQNVGVLLGVLGLVHLLAFLTLETDLQFRNRWPGLEVGAVSVVWTLSALGMLAVGLLRGVRFLRYCALAVLAVTIAKIFIIDLAELQQVYRILAFVVLGVLILAGGISYTRRER